MSLQEMSLAMNELAATVPTLRRVPSGIAGLDEILRGGFLEGGVYIVQGAPGAGKTILGNEICFRHTARGGRAAYVTLLAELHTRMLQHLRPMSFFNEAAIPTSLYYVSAFHMLEDSGLEGLIDVLRREIKERCATLLIIDGLVAAEESARSDREFKKFIHEIQAHAGAYDCTVLLLTSGAAGNVRAEHTMVDGVIELEDHLMQFRTERTLQVRKFRGSSFLRGRHPFRITNDGIVLFPRIEAAFADPSRPCSPAMRGKISIGVTGLDEMLGGGLPTCSTTGVVGASGVGKTTLALHFLSRANEAERGLFFGFFETPEALRLKAQHLGLGLTAALERGHVEMLWQPQKENILDELAYRLVDSVKRTKARRVEIDGLNGFVDSASHPERMGRFFACLVNELQALEATTLFTMETRDVIGGTVRVPVSGVSALVQNLIFLRFVEYRSDLLRLVSIGKVRDSDHDPRLREFAISNHGLQVRGVFAGLEGVTSGIAHEVPSGSVSTARGEGS
jgi:circadian clock protein KaiC